MPKLYLYLIFIIVCFNAQSQQLGIKHYQRNIDSFEFVFPTELFSSEGLLVMLPDSLYDFGNVFIKKAKFPSFTAKNCSINFKSDTVKTVQFSIVGNKNYKRYMKFMESSTLNFPEQEAPNETRSKIQLQVTETNKFNYSTQKKGRKVLIIMTSK